MVMSFVESTTNPHLRRKDLDAETLLKLLQIEEQGQQTEPSEGDFGLLYSPLRHLVSDSTEIVTGDFNHPPVILTIDKTYTVRRGETLTIRFGATDANNDVITWSRSGSRGSISNTEGSKGVFTYSPSNSAALGTHNITITASDGSKTDTVTISVTVKDVNQPPTITTPSNKTVYVGNQLRINLSASDPDNDPLTYTMTGNNGNLNSSTGVFSWRPVADDIGTHSITFTVSDGLQSASTSAVTITVRQQTQTNPVQLANISNITRTVGQSVRLTLSATGGNGTYTYSATGGGSVSGNIYSHPSVSTAQSKTITISVNSGGAQDSQSFTIRWNATTTESNQIPVITLTAPTTSTIYGSRVILTVRSTEVGTWNFEIQYRYYDANGNFTSGVTSWSGRTLSARQTFQFSFTAFENTYLDVKYRNLYCENTAGRSNLLSGSFRVDNR